MVVLRLKEIQNCEIDDSSNKSAAIYDKMDERNILSLEK